jgi:hypothetical protein
MPTTTKTRIVENTWDCLHCNHTNRGRDMECFKCGAPKGSAIVDKIPEAGAARDNAIVAPNTTLHTIFLQGSNWICEYCKNQVRAPNGKCRECGGDKERAKSVLEYRESMRLAREAQKILDGASDKKKLPAPPKPPIIEQTKYEVDPDAGYRQSAFKQQTSVKTAPFAVVHEDDFNIPRFSYDTMRTAAIVAGVVLLGAGFVWLMVYLFTDHDSNVVVNETHWTWTRQAQHDDRLHDFGSWQNSMHPRPIPSTISCVDRIRNTFNCGPNDSTAHDCETHEECTRVPDTCTHNPDICRTVNVPETCSTTPERCSESCRDRGNGSSSCTTTCTGGDRVCTGGGTTQDCRSVPDTCTRNPDHCENVTVCVCDNHENWCAYDYMQWNVVARQTTQGYDHNVIPDPSITIDPSDSRQRIVDEVHYRVKFRNSDNNWSYAPRGLTDYNRFTAGSHWLLRWNRVGTAVRPLHEIR